MKIDVTYELAKTVRGTLAKYDWTVQRLAEEMNSPFENVRRKTVGKKYEFSATELVEIAEIIGAPAWELLPDFMLPCPKTDLLSGAVQIDLLNVDAVPGFGTPTGEPEP